jgi:methyltransferase
MVTQWIFLAVVILLGAQRLFELRLSARNVAALRERGAIEMGDGLMPWMRLLHAAWLIAAPLEVFYYGRPFIPALAALAALGVLGGQALRYAAIHRLGPRWTVRVLVVPGAPPVTGGVLRWVRHPNYTGVILEILFLPLLHTAWVTATVFTVLNAIVLRSRIRTEEAALEVLLLYAPRYAAALGTLAIGLDAGPAQARQRLLDLPKKSP